MPNLPQDMLWPVPFRPPADEEGKWKALGEWLEALVEELHMMVTYLRRDLIEGTSLHRVQTTAPGVTDLEEGEFIFMDDTVSVRRLYTKLNGSVRYVNLT